jgi:hypothetical protein
MGTNYYCYDNSEKCPNCEHGSISVHLGKSSYGWKFLLNYNDGKYYETFREFQIFIKDKIILDEYDNEVENEYLIEKIKSKQNDKSHNDFFSYDEFYRDSDGYEFLDATFS